MKYELTKDIKFLTLPVPDFSFAQSDINPLTLSKNLLETLYSYGGVGLAANQCGLSYRCFVMAATPEDYVCFNPTIVWQSYETELGHEACLSFPGLSFEVLRPKQIRLRFTIPNGERMTLRMDGWTARVAIHETNHLDGKYFFEGVSRLKMQTAIRKAKKKGFDYEGKGLLAYCS